MATRVNRRRHSVSSLPASPLAEPPLFLLLWTPRGTCQTQALARRLATSAARTCLLGILTRRWDGCDEHYFQHRQTHIVFSRTTSDTQRFCGLIPIRWRRAVTRLDTVRRSGKQRRWRDVYLKLPSNKTGLLFALWQTGAGLFCVGCVVVAGGRRVAASRQPHRR